MPKNSVCKKSLIVLLGDEDPAKRPPFERIAVLLKAEYQSMVSGDMLDHSEKLVDKSRRSFRARVRTSNELYNEALDETA